MAEAQDIDQRAEAQPRGALGDSRQTDGWRRRQAQGRRVMLGNMIGVEAAAVIDLGELQPAFIELREARCATVDVVEDSEFHVLVPLKEAPLDCAETASSTLFDERIVRIDQDERDP